MSDDDYRISSEEHEVLNKIFTETLTHINANKDKLPNIRTSLLPYIMNLCEDALLPTLSKSDENYPQHLFAISAAFGWTIKQFMPFDVFMEHMHSSQMQLAHKVLADMLKQPDGVTRDDVDKAFEKESRRSMPGIG